MVVLLKKFLIISTFLISTIFFIDNVSASSLIENESLQQIFNDGAKATCNTNDGYLYLGNYKTDFSCTNNTNANAQQIVDNIDKVNVLYAQKENESAFIFLTTKPLVYATSGYPSSYHSNGFMSTNGTYGLSLMMWNEGKDDEYIGWYGSHSCTSNSSGYFSFDGITSDYVFSTYDVYKYDSSKENYYDENTIIFEKKISLNNLKLKNSFNSGTNAYGMSKIIWNINASTDVSAKDGIINFKLQYGANDFTNKNIPIFSHYKIYGMNSYESGWTDITNDERFYFDDFIYEYYTLEGVATETILTNTLHIPSDMCIYENIKVEFYFDNTNNFYMYVFDDLDDSSWEDMQYYFENYMYYEFPSDKKYAFISHASNSNNTGKVFVPYNHIINTNALFGAYIYDLNEKRVLRKLVEREFEEHDYYYYYDFDFSFDNNEVLLLQRKTGTNEKIGFYLPSDYIVEFANESENITILTPNGYIDIDGGKVENVFSNDKNLFGIFKGFNSNKDDIKKLFNDIWNSITTSIIYEYILILIVGTLIVVIIKGANR